MKIDWKMAPEWAIGHGIVVTCNIIKEVWFGDKAFMYVGDSRSYVYGGGTGETRHNITLGEIKVSELRPAAWTGEGLPPVGTVCERRTKYDDDGRYEQVRIIAHTSKGFPVWENTDALFAGIAKENMFSAGVPAFRPIRTPEQIAAEERDKEIARMVDALGCDPEATKTGEFVRCGILYDAGCRMPVKS